MKSSSSSSHPAVEALRVSLFLLTLASAPLAAELVVVQNDSVIDFGSAAIQAGFVAGERGASWLTPQCSGELVAVRILWLDFENTGSQTLGDTVTVSQAGTFPVPGAPIVELVAPLMTEGVFNEFVIDPPVPVASGETLVVDFKFLTSPPALGPSLVTDIDGCQALKNGVFAMPPGAWADLCSFGVSGDLAIRALVSCESVIFSDGFESGDTSAWSVTQEEAPSTLRLAYPVLRVDPDLPPFWRRVDSN